MKRMSFYKPASSVTGTDVRLPAKPVRREIVSKTGKKQIQFVGYENDLTVPEIKFRLQHLDAQLTVTHSVFKWTYGERCHLNRMLNRIIDKMARYEPLTRYEMNFIHKIELPKENVEET